MKTKLTVTIDEELLPKAKTHARSKGLSLSLLIEKTLAARVSEGRPSFSRRWHGCFLPVGFDDERYERLARKYS